MNLNMATQASNHRLDQDRGVQAPTHSCTAMRHHWRRSTSGAWCILVWFIHPPKAHMEPSIIELGLEPDCSIGLGMLGSNLTITTGAVCVTEQWVANWRLDVIEIRRTKVCGGVLTPECSQFSPKQIHVLRFPHLYIGHLFYFNIIHLYSICQSAHMSLKQPKYINIVFSKTRGAPKTIYTLYSSCTFHETPIEMRRVKLMPARHEGKWVASASQSAHSKQLQQLRYLVSLYFSKYRSSLTYKQVQTDSLPLLSYLSLAYLFAVTFHLVFWSLT